MGGRTAATTRAKTSTSTLAAPARSSARAQAPTVAPEVSTSSTKTSLPPDHLGLAVGGNAERALHVERAVGLGETDLLGGRLAALERPIGDRPAAGLGDDLGEQGRLVEPPCPLAAPMQRHRHHGIGIGDELTAGIRHPAPHGGREIEPIAVFQGMDEGAGDVVVAHRRARPVVGRRIGDRLHRQQTRPAVERERNAEPLAIGRRDERKLRPAGRAQAWVADRLAAGGAEVRQRDVDRVAQSRAQRRTQAGKAAGPGFAGRDLPVHDPDASAPLRRPQCPYHCGRTLLLL